MVKMGTVEDHTGKRSAQADAFESADSWYHWCVGCDLF